jgi:hypothetical protein
MTIQQFLVAAGACRSARDWADGKTLDQVLETCVASDYWEWAHTTLSIDLKQYGCTCGKGADIVCIFAAEERAWDQPALIAEVRQRLIEAGVEP